ncbi:MAG TPA: YaiO family outer membrane beta-barrel protein, partial [Bacteroidia bacterium]|nr:YaiO family outer membrane beta-barrel protein [Bacteroidia bacterium]
KEALLLIDTILKNHSDCEEALALRTFIYQKKKRTFSLSYHNTSFTNPALQPWHLMYLEYKQNIQKVPSVFRLNYGNMYMKSEGQFELDLYPKLTLSSYLYLNAGASEGKYIFPQIRGGVEYYKNVNKTDLSIGVRYLRFKSTQVTLATGQISSTIRNWIISYRPFVSVVGKNLYPSHTFIFKIPNEVKEAFLQFDIQYGNVPYNFYFLNEFVRVNSIRAGIQCQFRIKSSVFIRPVFMYEYEEYYPEKYRNRYNSQIIITKRI